MSEGNNYCFEVNDEGKKIVEHFADSTSLHGVNKAADQSDRITGTRKYMWTTLLILSIVGAVLVVAIQVQDYLNYRTQIQLKHQFVSSLPFPAVTICSLNNHYSNNITMTQRKIAAMHEIALSQLRKNTRKDEIYSVLVQALGLTNQTHSVFNCLKNLKNIRNTKGEDRVAILQAMQELWCNNGTHNEATIKQLQRDMQIMSYNISWSLKMCSFGNRWNQKCDYTLFKPAHDLSFGTCWTINGIGQNHFKQLYPGEESGLHLILRNPQNNFIKNIINSKIGAGLKVIIHPISEPPNTQEIGIYVSPGQQHYMEIKQKTEKYIKPPWGHCEKENLQYYPTYTKMAAENECVEKLVGKQCNCSIFNLSNSTTCSTYQLATCVRKLKWGNYTSTQESKRWQACNNKFNSCNFTTYETLSSSVKWPAEAAMKYFTTFTNDTSNRIKHDYTSISIYYPKLVTEQYTQVVQIDVATLLGSMGGTMGLFLGASIMTLCEVTEFMLLWVQNAIKVAFRRIRKKNDELDTEKTKLLAN